MALKDYFNFSKKETPVTSQIDENSFFSFSLKTPELPTIKEKANQDYVSYGDDNNYPQNINTLICQSAMQSAIIRTKAKMMAGDSILINDVEVEQLTISSKTDIIRFIEDNNLYEVKNKIADDFQRYGAMCVEVIWSMNFQKIAKVKYIKVENIRSGKMVNGVVKEYYYKQNWSDRNSKEVKIAAFDKDDKTNYNQLIYIKQGNLDYYGQPSFESALKWIAIDAKLGRFHDSAISKNFSFGMTINIYGAPADEMKRQDIVSKLKRQYEGEDNAGKVAVFFSDNKETATEIKATEVSNLDKNLLVLSDQCVSHILTANSVTTPLLFGIATAGQLGASNQLEIGYKIFDKTVVRPDRFLIEQLFTKIFKTNYSDVTKVTLQEFNPLV